MASRQQPHLSDAQLAELSALADGSLDPARRPAVEARMAESPQLRQLYERERLVVERIRQAAATERAPARLHARIQTQQTQRVTPVPLGRWRMGYAALASALAAAILAVVLALPAGTPGSPSVSQAALLALRGPSAAAPGADPQNPGAKLAQRLQDVYFPNWSTTLGWRAVGQRRDRLGARPAVTVYYQWHGRRIAYTIVGAPVLAQPTAPVTRINGWGLRTLRMGIRTVVTWRRAGHTCVLSGQGVSAHALEQLAAWRAGDLSD